MEVALAVVITFLLLAHLGLAVRVRQLERQLAASCQIARKGFEATAEQLTKLGNAVIALERESDEKFVHKNELQ